MLLLAITMLAGMEVGNGSRYGYEGDEFDNVGTFACRRTLTARYGQKAWQKMRNHGVAHRTLPCGERLGICNQRTGLCTTAYVVDRGPWGALNHKGEWHVRTGKLLPGEHYRGVLDLLPGVYSAIELRGIEKVTFWSMPDQGMAKSSRDHRLPPLRSLGPSPYAFYLAPSHRSTPFPPLRNVDAPVMMAGLTAPKQLHRVGELPPLRGPETLAAESPMLTSVSRTFPVIRPLPQTFPPLRDAQVPMPEVLVQSRFGSGRSARPAIIPSSRPLPANS